MVEVAVVIVVVVMVETALVVSHIFNCLFVNNHCWLPSLFLPSDCCQKKFIEAISGSF